MGEWLSQAAGIPAKETSDTTTVLNHELSIIVFSTQMAVPYIFFVGARDPVLIFEMFFASHKFIKSQGEKIWAI
jgi:hypothetical protein